MRRIALAVLCALAATVALGGSAARSATCTPIAIDGKRVSESAGSVTFTIVAEPLPPPPPTTIPPPTTTVPPAPFNATQAPPCNDVVDYSTADGTATAGEDYTAKRGSVTLAPGQRATVRVPIINDTINEPDETFTLRAGEESGTATIVDDDPPPAMSVTSAPAADGRTQVFTLSLSGPSGFPITATYSTADGTATAGTDYVAQRGTVTFPPGTTRQTVPVPLLSNPAAVGDKAFTLSISAPQNATIGTGTAQGVVHHARAPTNPGGQTGPAGPLSPLAPSTVKQDKTPPVLVITPVTEGDGFLVWTVTCPPTEQTCTGKVKVVSLVSAARRASAAKARKVKLGSARYGLKGGETKKIKVPLSKRGKDLVRKRKTLPAKATFTTTDSAGNVSTTSQLITLHASAFRHS
jgi:hypothetical protein